MGASHLIKNIGVLLVNLLGHFLLLFLELSDALVGIDAGAHTAEDYRADDEQKDQPDGAKVPLLATDVVDVVDTGLIPELVVIVLELKLSYGVVQQILLIVVTITVFIVIKQLLLLSGTLRHIYAEIN